MLTGLPRTWAHELKFDFGRDRAHFSDSEYFSVRLVRVTPTDAPTDATLTHEAVVPLTARPVAAMEPPPPARLRKPRGRPPFPLKEMIAIARDSGRSRSPTNKAEASALLEAYVRDFPGQKAPAFGTVHDHVARIYAAAAPTALPINPVKQLK